VDTKPQLEIFADDVKCGHGGTVGQLDEAALFYLRSRGVALDEARSLLIYAFAREMVERVGSPAVRARARDLVAARLPAGARLLEAA
jgi:Fe-S cluster assembly protein SufD